MPTMMQQDASYPRVIKVLKVTDKAKLQITSYVMRTMGLKDGDLVQWVEWKPGTFIVEPVRKPQETGFRPFQPV